MATNPVSPRRPELSGRELVASAWRDAPQVLRRLAIWLWSIAVLAAAASTTADVRGWWRGLSLLPNLVSEAIAAMIALPIVLLVVNRLAAYRDEVAARPRLEARVRAARRRLNEVVRRLHAHITKMERDATAVANDLLAAVGDAQSHASGAGADLGKVNAAARAMHSLMPPPVTFRRLITLVRIYGTSLTGALTELDNALTEQGNRDVTDNIVEVAQLSSDLDAVVRHHDEIITKAQGLFGTRPALSRHDGAVLSDLRTTTSEYVRSFDRMLQACAELDAVTSDPEGAP